MSTPARQSRQRLAARLRARPLLVDTVIAGSLSVVSVMALFVHDTLPDARPADALGVLLLLCSCLPLVARRRAPVAVLLAVAVPTTVLLALDYAGSIGVGLIIAVYTVAAYRGRALAWLALAVGLAGFLLSRPFVDQQVGVADVVAVAGVVFAASAFGRSIGFRRAYTAELELRAHRLEQARESDVRAVIAEERGRIARELHDVVAHHVSVMTVQASAAQRTLARNPDAAREAMAAVESTGRAALVEMRRIVGVLRADDEREALPPARARRAAHAGRAGARSRAGRRSGGRGHRAACLAAQRPAGGGDGVAARTPPYGRRLPSCADGREPPRQPGPGTDRDTAAASALGSLAAADGRSRPLATSSA